MAPPMINSSALSIMALMTWILSETFFPPMIARNGLAGDSSFPWRNSSSAAMRNPIALCPMW